MRLVILPVLILIGGVTAVVAIVVGLIRLARKKRLERDARWQEAGTELGLDFHSKSKRKGRRLDGAIEGLSVEVRTITESTGNSSQAFTEVRVGYPPLDLGLKVRRRGGLTRLTRIFQRDHVETGDSAFDERIVIRAQSASGVRALLTPDVREHLLQAFATTKDLVVTDAAVIRRDRGQPKWAQQIVRAVRGTVDVALVIDSARGTKRGGANPRARLIAPEVAPEPVAKTDPQPMVVGAGAAVEPAPDALPARATSPPVNPAPADPAAEEPAPEQDRASPVISEPSGSSVPVELDVAAAELFEMGLLPSEIERRFRETYAGHRVRGVGTLTRLEGGFSPDGHEPIERGVFVLGSDLAAGASSRGATIVMVLPKGSPIDLGAFCTIEGELAACDALMQRLELAHSSLIQEIGT